MISLRYYQREAIDALYRYFETKDGNPLVVMPTGTGKSRVMAGFLEEIFRTWPDSRVLCLTHVRELIVQNYGALKETWHDAPAGVYSAGLNRREMDAQILFAGIQSIHRRAYDVQQCDLVLIDEAHLLGRKDSGMYRRFLSDLLQINPAMKVIGLTATPYRLDSGMLHEGTDRLFTDIAYDLPMLKMMEEGYLCWVVPKATDMMLDVSGVGTRGGEFIPGELEAAVNTDAINQSAVNEIINAGQDRGSWLLFCAGVDHAQAVADELVSRGINAACVTGETPSPERDRLLRLFKAGKIKALTNMGVLTTGFDAPGVDLIAMLRPTKSISLYVQMIGRGTRIAPGKEDCVVLDFARNTLRHGTVDDAHKRVKKPGPKDGEGEAPTKTCPECQTIVAASARECRGCGYDFPPPETKLATQSETSAILSTQIRTEWLEVRAVEYHRHAKIGGRPSLCVTYTCEFGRHREWVCLEHNGYPREKAAAWWRRRDIGAVPTTIEEAMGLVDDLMTPSHIAVRPVGQYTEITGYRGI
jgi:DNA repair protein RadD